MLNFKFLCLIFLVLGCQTIPKTVDELKEIPVYIQNSFNSCDNHDGGGVISLSQESSVFNSLKYDWIAKNQKLHFQATNILGSTLLDIQLSKKRVDIEGSLKDKVPKLAIKEDFLNVDGHKIGIKYHEVACLLNFSLPKSWSGKIASYIPSENGGEIELIKDWRKISIKFTDKQKVCTTISWSYYWGLSSYSVVLCSFYGKKKSGSLTGLDDFYLNWVSDE